MRITYDGMDGTGRTLTDARRDAAHKIEQALSGTYDPVLLPLPDGDIMLGFRTPTEGWSYWFWRDGRLSGGCLCALTTREELERRMRRHAAQSTEDSRYLEHPTCTEQDKRDFDEYRRLAATATRPRRPWASPTARPTPTPRPRPASPGAAHTRTRQDSPTRPGIPRCSAAPPPRFHSRPHGHR